MNKRLMLIAILLLNGLAAATTVLARELSEPAHTMTMPATASADLVRLVQPAEQALRLVGSPAFPTAAGWATVDAAGREIKVEVSGLAALAGQTIEVTLGGARAGSMTVGADGQGALRVEGDSAGAILAAANGTALELRAGAAVIASSQLQTDDNGDDNANDNGDDNANDNGDDNANDNGDDNANDNGDDDTNDNGDDNANDNGDDNANDNGDDNANDNGDDHGGHDDHGGDDNSGAGHDDHSGHN
ncbi:MAG TPA: hypothetical protein PK829_13535 [Promineifilum sp.]|nr:hypothetical protein [Promineifilum sp.]